MPRTPFESEWRVSCRFLYQSYRSAKPNHEGQLLDVAVSFGRESGYIYVYDKRMHVERSGSIQSLLLASSDTFPRGIKVQKGLPVRQG